MDDTWMMVETKLRVPPWLAIATMVKLRLSYEYSMCCLGPSALPARVMTTTLCVNAQELR